MNYRGFIPFDILFFLGSSCFVQADGFAPSTSNTPGMQYPLVNVDGRLRAHFRALDANKVQLDIAVRNMIW